MIDPLDFIDPDEGREDLQAFYAEALPCESCGRPTWQGRRWDEEYSLWIAVDCGCNVAAAPTCPLLIPLLDNCETVQEVCDVIRAHRQTCPKCGPTPISDAQLPEAA